MKPAIQSIAVFSIALLVGCGRSNQQPPPPAPSAAAPPMMANRKTMQADGDLSELSSALGLYQSQTGSLPQQLDDLMKNPGVSGWRGPYLHELPKDPWGHPYIYHRSGSDFKILSAGPDGQEGTADDIGG